MARTLAAVAEKLDARLIGDDAGFASVSIDTRKLDDGDLFIAVKGDKFDGNDFVVDAHAKGAAGALVSRRAETELPQVKVKDTRVAFGRMARAWRENFGIPVVAVTGSNGKTTVKELIASILSCRYNICVTQGNLNNDLGVPNRPSVSSRMPARPIWRDSNRSRVSRPRKANCSIICLEREPLSSMPTIATAATGKPVVVPKRF
jgi:UDP-N-acetylmuramyl pentapeptide synthase